MPAFFFTVHWSPEVSGIMAENPRPTLEEVADAVSPEGGRIRLQGPDPATGSALFVVEGSADFDTYWSALHRNLGNRISLISFEDVGITLPEFEGSDIEVHPTVVIMPAAQDMSEVLMAVPDTKRLCTCGAVLPRHNRGCPWGVI